MLRRRPEGVDSSSLELELRSRRTLPPSLRDLMRLAFKGLSENGSGCADIHDSQTANRHERPQTEEQDGLLPLEPIQLARQGRSIQSCRSGDLSSNPGLFFQSRQTQRGSR
jgi:hypothetical protein